ncbi:DUF4232 domain-containing protein [Streptomyces griseomycini]|uniref:DUF4232 domain-containing protein n=1 Tax=Streptomyces griseomycini TaxID=66895 RepID=A0A7W7PPA1_9ACTN|nr:DUF4232 domain-containing protein [Streptomyces griseomycini]MBB4898266.1 hypothetical protein [Streptomyces griseomycini]GGQ29150.1 hypothetical protein GCM10010266_60540 [Streptomyces griseomycini]GGR45397.1 hypothetical protein GCM10015536_58960 [Streptomyces griseomycini]
MRATPIAVPATLAALLLLAACDSAGGDEDGDGKREGAACSVHEVSIEVGPASIAPAAGDTGEVPVSLTNRGAACTLDGFPEVTLVGAGDSPAVDVPPAEGAEAQKLTLAKGGSASFTVAYERGTPRGGAFDAENLRVRLPGDADRTRSRLFRWSYGPVAGGGQGDHEVSVSAYQRAGD